MSALRRLMDGDFAAYFTPAPQSTIWVSVHIPKTAGSSLGMDLGSVLAPSTNIFVGPASVGETHKAKFAYEMARFLESAARRRPRFVTGHFMGDDVEQLLAALPGARVFTLLRDPVRRAISDYFYMRSPAHNESAAFSAAYPTFQCFLETHPTRNKMAVHLVPRSVLRKGDAQACIDWIYAHYAFVGLQEAYATSFAALTRLIGVRAWPKAQLRVRQAQPEEEVPVTAALREAILAKHPLDCAIFAALGARFEALAPALAHFLAAPVVR